MSGMVIAHPRHGERTQLSLPESHIPAYGAKACSVDGATKPPFFLRCQYTAREALTNPRPVFEEQANLHAATRERPFVPNPVWSAWLIYHRCVHLTGLPDGGSRLPADNTVAILIIPNVR